MSDEGGHVVRLVRPNVAAEAAERAELASFLKKLIDRVDAGEVVGIGVAYVLKDGAVGSAWSGGDNRHGLTAAASGLWWRMQFDQWGRDD